MINPVDVALLLAQASDPLAGFAGYGVVGTVAAVALVALRAVYQQQIKTLNEIVTAERARADRIEAQLNSLNGDVRDRVLVSMSSSADAFRETLRVLEGRQR
jgi:uncharacterized coiled-coil protein SlyX